MASRLNRSESGLAGVRRMLRRETKRALRAIDSGRAPRGEAIPDARKHLKKARAALRLARAARFRRDDGERSRFRHDEPPWRALGAAGLGANSDSLLANRRARIGFKSPARFSVEAWDGGDAAGMRVSTGRSSAIALSVLRRSAEFPVRSRRRTNLRRRLL
jgi:hypothetical protein